MTYLPSFFLAKGQAVGEQHLKEPSLDEVDQVGPYPVLAWQMGRYREDQGGTGQRDSGETVSTQYLVIEHETRPNYTYSLVGIPIVCTVCALPGVESSRPLGRVERTKVRLHIVSASTYGMNYSH